MKLTQNLFSMAVLMALASWTVAASAQDCPSGGCGPGVAGAACPGGTCGVGGMINDGNCGPAPHVPCPEVGPSTDCIGAVGPNGKRYLNPVTKARLVWNDPFSPQPHYAYGSAGLDATRTDRWNRQQAAQYSWHGGYNYWRYGQPTALVVPPTAAFQTEYNWGVAQTRSLPIYAQFGNGGGGVIGGGGGAGFSNTPYWPSSTSQFGIYPVRSPW